jgi:hypothetical protein
MPFIPSLASYSYDGTWFLAKALDNVVRNHGVKLENIQTGNETFYELLISRLSSVTFTGLTVRTLGNPDSLVIQTLHSHYFLSTLHSHYFLSPWLRRGLLMRTNVFKRHELLPKFHNYAVHRNFQKIVL